MQMTSCGFQFQAMSSACEIRLDAVAGDGESVLAAAAQLAIGEVRRIEAKYTRYRADSIVSRINAVAGSGEAIEVDDETASLLDFACMLNQLSDGLSDITSGVLRRAWDFKAGKLPKPQVLQTMRYQIRWQHVKRHDGQVRLAGENPASTRRS